MTSEIEISFSDLGLSKSIISALNDLGYKKPSPIQKKCIPILLKGRDVLGIAQTGSGKTAAFFLPLLHKINFLLKHSQILILEPTRELAIQVAHAGIGFSKYIPTIHITALYGGQNYDIQLRSLKHNPQVIVATPGRLLDHLNKKTVNLSFLNAVVLDEADEMLRMGFIEDVNNIMSQIPSKHQTALFSATMPNVIRRITQRFMKAPYEINIKLNKITKPDIVQSYCLLNTGISKNDALIRFLEIEDYDAVIIFVRTKNTTLEISEVLEGYGYNSAALNGDMNQTLREQTVQRLKNGCLDILIATDVAARGLDIDRISLVINYDIPIDSESYVHRIGRTGRAGRTGKAILFIYHREYKLLRNIERFLNHSINEIKLPSLRILCERRQAKFITNIQKVLLSSDLDQYQNLLKKIYDHYKIDLNILGAALLKIAQGNKPLLFSSDIIKADFSRVNYKNNHSIKYHDNYLNKKNKRLKHNINNMELYRIEVGRNDGVEVRHIVGTISNEADISSRHIGHIKLFASHSTVELPKGISNNLINQLTRTRILNKFMHIQLLGDAKHFKNKSMLK
uniref:ATP-dependent RNA helicase DeaD n=1 Tax=Candidatus Aschnera chinzeii TaxID=1485666 RepID=A0AAT9G3P7_9ENTR|nr:MAG: DEAD/DEAH family ATP-dependent RNA helicase [Candidatus Aschnera chinzeii]